MEIMRLRLFTRFAQTVLLASILAACATAPFDYPKNYSEALVDTDNTSLGKEVAEWTGAHPGQSGFYPLIEGLDALGVRLAMIDAAERTIDAQYFLMKPDSAGRLFAGKLLQAADRGVRVRLLLDDIFTTVDDSALLVLNQHPNVELRLFNPIGRRGIYHLNYLGDFKNANRRMHNKSFTVDNQVSVVGGRNIADEYFELLTDTEFRDFDMFAMGPVAAEVSATFDLFWNHRLAVPMEAFESGKELPDLESARANVDKNTIEASRSIYGRALDSPLMRDIAQDRVKLFPGESRVITDDPEKLLNKVSAEHKILVTALAGLIDEATSEVVVITPYFIPGEAGVEFWRTITSRGVRVVIVTNSLASNNHVPVHGGYTRYRGDMIDAGVEMYETRVDAAKTQQVDSEQVYDSLTLHTKGIIIDRRYTFVGSLNLDPRSIDINTEAGILIDSAELAGNLLDGFFLNLPQFSYRVTQNEKGKLRWTTIIDGEETVETKEPQASRWLRFKAFLSKILPEGQL
jgi:putative cardiolipin synthase